MPDHTSRLAQRHATPDHAPAAQPCRTHHIDRRRSG